MSGICCKVVGRGTRVGVARGQGGWGVGGSWVGAMGSWHFMVLFCLYFCDGLKFSMEKV